MEIDATDIGGSVTCFRLHGSVGDSDVPLLSLTWDEVIGSRARDAAIDLSRVTSISTGALRWLLAAGDAVRARGKALVLFGAAEPVRWTLQHHAIDRTIPLVATQDDVVDRLYA
jgi:anti-anti-sigma regulatory factor